MQQRKDLTGASVSGVQTLQPRVSTSYKREDTDMQKIQRLWPHTKWYTDDEALSFVVDLEDMGVDPS